MTSFTITCETLTRVLQDLRAHMKKTSSYKLGQDIQSIQNAYVQIVSVAGEKENTIQKTKLVVVKYINNQNELCSLHVPFKNVYKHMPEILHI